MKFLPLLKTCIRALVRNPMRAALTILGYNPISVSTVTTYPLDIPYTPFPW